ncbi:helix-turn-helix transcriptional regulator [Hymenobacter fodinae]|uniref:AraC family transcriptional regulator n=1 Tax=Hymenobacter fodinae TaxID=2510796 RepID=A0A4Z0NZR8_9BACT|nr:helix-turn-helix transcriptional regulator [Hymenobacter fodinae]TGE03827.1 AraC family transcriptional regulator [Hymenobacter fodinae]
MHYVGTGQFFGQTNRLLQVGALTLTDTEYTHEQVDWHYHENAYFTLLLTGQMLEGSRQHQQWCTAGTLLYHHWQEAHYNRKPPGYTRGFHLEVPPAWFVSVGLTPSAVQGSLLVRDPAVTTILYQILRESQLNDASSALAIESLLTAGLQHLARGAALVRTVAPPWVTQLRDLLHDSPDMSWTLTGLAQEVGLHPAHLSRSFPQYFSATLGQYVRHLRVQRALTLLLDPQRSLLDIALACGFYDQSHFNRCFKALLHERPTQYRRVLRR